MNSRELKFEPASLRYRGIVGTGGIGSGKFFVLNGDHTLGREESRSGHFLEINDYCKQHIILHYVKVLLGPKFPVMPIGRIGDDDIGKGLFSEMLETGFDMRWVEKIPGSSTLFSFCFSYPDGSGGNLTTDNSASSKVDAGLIEMASSEIQKLGQKGIILLAPEVPLEARKKLLEIGRMNGLFCAASFTTDEIRDPLTQSMLAGTDILAINLDEASAAAGLSSAGNDTSFIVQSAVQNLRKINPGIWVSITAGKDGSWCWDGVTLNWFPAMKASVVSTAGAGDAFFSGLICGISLGLAFFEAQQLGTLVAGLSVTSPHTINKGIDRDSLRNFIKTSDIKYSENILKLLED